MLALRSAASIAAFFAKDGAALLLTMVLAAFGALATAAGAGMSTPMGEAPA